MGKQDPLGAVIVEHWNAANAIRNDETADRKAYREHWLERYRRAVGDHPDSPYVDAARFRMVGLLNSLGRPVDSLEVLEALLQNAGTEHERIHLLYQMALVAENAYMLHKSPRFAERSMKAFSKIRSMEDQPSAYGLEGLTRSARLESIAFGNHRTAAEMYLKANEWVTQWLPRQPKDIQEAWSRPGSERLLSDAAQEYAKAGRPVEAVAVMKDLQVLPGRVRPMRFHLKLVTEASDPLALEVVEYAADWMATSKMDSKTVEIAYLVGTRLAQSKNPERQERGIQWIEATLTRLEQADVDLSQRKRVATLVGSLHHAYYTRGRESEARMARQRFAHLNSKK